MKLKFTEEIYYFESVSYMINTSKRTKYNKHYWHNLFSKLIFSESKLHAGRNFSALGLCMIQWKS